MSVHSGQVTIEKYVTTYFFRSFLVVTFDDYLKITAFLLITLRVTLILDICVYPS